MDLGRKGWKGILIATLSIAAVACSASEVDVTGTYEGVGGHRSSMVISKKQGRVHITLRGGAVTTGSVSVAADCEATAEGEIANGAIRARLIPFEGELTSLDAKDIARMDPRVLVSFEKNIAIVEGSFAHCGLLNALNGKYKRR